MVTRAVIDTNVIFEGLTKLGACGEIVDAWKDRKFIPCVSTALGLEYEEVLGRKFGQERARQALAALQALLGRAEFVPIYYTVRPSSPDADDDFIIDCAFNASAVIVTRNVRDFPGLEASLGIQILTPEEFITRLRGS